MAKRAQFPQSGYSRTTADDLDSLTLSVVGESGELFGEFGFSNVQAPKQVVADLVCAFQSGTSSTGRWRSKATVKSAAAMLRLFATAIATANPHLESMAGFTPEMWWEWRTKVRNRTRWPGQINKVRCLLYEVENLMPATRRALAGREKKPKKRLYESYSVREYRRIYAAAWSTVRVARRRIRSSLAALDAFHNGLESIDTPTLRIKKEEWTRGRLLDHIYSTGNFPGGHIPHYCIDEVRDLLRVEHVGSVSQAVFASTAEVFAGIVLLVCERGFNLTVVNGMTSKPHNSDVIRNEVTVQELDKPRRGPDSRYFSSSFSGKAGRIWRAVAEITQPARDHLALRGESSDTLLLGRVLEGHSTGDIFKSDWSQCRSVAASWQKVSELTTDDGEPLVVDFRRLRLTEQVVNRRSNQNSERVSESVYRIPDKQTKETARSVILQGQRDAVSDAKAVMAVRAITAAEQARAEADPKELAQALNVTVSRVRQLLRGECDTVVTACADITQSPFGQDGKVCPASFLQCLSCRNAIATPKHLPRLVLLLDAVSEMASVVSDAVWEADYKSVHQQLSSLLLNYSTTPERAEARNKVTESDKDAIRQLLDRRYDA